MDKIGDLSYRTFEIDEPHHHNQNLVGTLHKTSLLYSTEMKTAVKDVIEVAVSSQLIQGV
ncbi:MAG: hypothetical protein QNJ68_05275 [Microcoleaceae cyanobacterium MO_207.B10]|nr:hypothetical protein [Microcoleaceae cyanobacterium MO_207.B10]